jgi:hypothetical protein
MFWGKSSYKNLSPLRTRGDKVPALIYYGGQLRPGFLSAYTMGDKTFVCFRLGEQSLPGFKTEYKQEPFEILCRQKRIVWLNGCEYYGKPESMKWNNADYDRLYDKVAAWKGGSPTGIGFCSKTATDNTGIN